MLPEIYREYCDLAIEDIKYTSDSFSLENFHEKCCYINYI